MKRKENFKKTNIFCIATRVNLIHVSDVSEQTIKGAADKNKVLHQTPLLHFQLVLNLELVKPVIASCTGHSYVTIGFIIFETKCQIYSKSRVPVRSTQTRRQQYAIHSFAVGLF